MAEQDAPLRNRWIIVINKTTRKHDPHFRVSFDQRPTKVSEGSGVRPSKKNFYLFQIL